MLRPHQTPAPASATARALLKTRSEEHGTTFENRADDAAYVEALLRALRQRARELAHARQRLAKIRAENARRAGDLGVNVDDLEKKIAARKNGEEDGKLEGAHD